MALLINPGVALPTKPHSPYRQQGPCNPLRESPSLSLRIPEPLPTNPSQALPIPEALLTNPRPRLSLQSRRGLRLSLQIPEALPTNPRGSPYESPRLLLAIPEALPIIPYMYDLTIWETIHTNP